MKREKRRIFLSLKVSESETLMIRLAQVHPFFFPSFERRNRRERGKVREKEKRKRTFFGREENENKKEERRESIFNER